MGKKTKVGKARKDKFYQLAKETGFRSRAAFKLIQLNRRFCFLQQSQVCIDLCAAPGGWMQVAKQNMPVSSIVIGVDLFPIRPISGCIAIVEDITTEKCKTSLSKELQTWKADVVLHDGAPNVGKNWLFDAYQQICLTLNALKLATHFLRGGGWFVTKIFRSKDYNALLWVLKQLFNKVHATKPSASRKESAEIFVVCQGYLAPDKIDARLLDPKYVFEELDIEGKKKISLLHPERQKRIKAEGYSEKEIALRNDLSATEFMQSTSGLDSLEGIGSIRIDDERILNHPKTTTEIIECCRDIKVLGRKDIKHLLAWWKTVKEDLFKETEEVPTIEDEEEKIPRLLTQEEIENMEEEEIERQISQLADEEKKELKRKRKKTMKAKTKLNEKMNLKMVIKGDEGPREEAEQDIFTLKSIKTAHELEDILDAEPNVLAADSEITSEKLPKYVKYQKDDQRMDDDANYENDDDSEISMESDSETESNAKGELGLSDEDGSDEEKENISEVKKKKKADQHPLIKPCDYRDKDTKRQHRVQLWFEKESLQKVDSEDDEENDLDCLTNDYKAKGVDILGNNNTEIGNKMLRKNVTTKTLQEDEDSYSSSSDSDSESESEMENENKKKKPKEKKIRLTEEELALGTMMVNGKKTKRDLIDSAWNRYAFNDQNLPQWFVQDEELHMKKPLPVPKELDEEYQRKVQELNARPIKKVMEAKARKKRRAVKKLAKAKKTAEKIMESGDYTAQEKVRQLKKIYKKAEEKKKKEVTYVVAKKHLAQKRTRRPPGVKGLYKVVDPRQKKDTRGLKAKMKRRKKRKN